MAPSIQERFPTAANGTPPTQEQRTAVSRIQQSVIQLAEWIDGLVPDGRDKSIALTALEDVLMRANRGIFTGAR